MKIGSIHKIVLLNGNYYAWDIFETQPNDYEAEHSLCLTDKDSVVDLSVLMETENEVPLTFTIDIIRNESFIKQIDKEYHDLVNYGTPVFYRVNMPEISNDTDYLNIVLNSIDDGCAEISIHPLECPIKETSEGSQKEDSIKRPYFFTMLKKGALVINARDYDTNKGFFIKFELVPDCRCKSSKSACDVQFLNASKSITWKITQQYTDDEIIRDAIITIAILLFISIIMIFVLPRMSNVSNIYPTYPEENRYGKKQNLDMQMGRDSDKIFVLPRMSNVSNIYSTYPEENKHGKKQNLDMQVGRDSDKIVEPESMNPSDTVYLNQLCKKEDEIRKIYLENELHIWMVLILGVCYSIPALQLLLKYQELMQTSGNNDLCYYNFLCSIRTETFLDFNHIFSNVGYIVFGIAFIIIVRLRHIKYKKINKKSINLGVPQHFGIYYAMGLSLNFVGLLSSFFHVCPTKENFQFDTTFMYAIAALMISKIFQFRHPDVSADAYKIFFGLSIVVLLVMIGIHLKELTATGFALYWTFFIIVYMTILIKILLVIYTSGKWKRPHEEWQDFKKLRLMWTQIDWMKGRNVKGKTIFVICAIIANFLLILAYTITFAKIKMPDFILFAFIGNLMLYFGYYCTMKHVNHERMSLTVYILIISFMACCIPAYLLFTDKAKTTNVSHAASRNMNQDCIIGMYDSHDLWHFLSALALFSFSMLLVVIDDDVAEIPRNQIAVF